MMEMPFIMGSLGSFLRAGGYGRASFDVPLEIVEAGTHAIFSYKDAQITKVTSHPWIAKEVAVRGFIFDVDTDRLREVTVDSQQNVAA